MDECHAWAAEVFGAAKLGDIRRSVRLVQIAGDCAQTPRGSVRGVSGNPADQEGAYRFLESRLVNTAAVAMPMFAATARTCSERQQLIVAVDQTTLSFVDRKQVRGLGRTSTSQPNYVRRGFEVMTALAVGSSGETLGVLAQEWLLRSEERAPTQSSDPRPHEQRESALWTRAISSLTSVLQAHAAHTRPWLQMDRGADDVQVLQLASKLDIDFTIRSCQNRALSSGGKLHTAIRRSAPLGTVSLTIPVSDETSPATRTREAILTVRACRVRLRVPNSQGKKKGSLPITVVQIREDGRLRAYEPIEWTLLTNHRVSSLQQALEVVRAYRLRWRIEEFFRAWKSGVCDLESSQLRSPDALRRWATILAAVAARAEQLKTMSRTTPDAPATDALSQDEIDTAIILTNTTKFRVGDRLSLQQAVELIACVGGHKVTRSGGPPGAIVIGRGLTSVLIGVRASTT